MSTPNLDAAPENYRGVRITQTEANLFSVTFPTTWCHRELLVVGGCRNCDVQDAQLAVPSLRAAIEEVLPVAIKEPGNDIKQKLSAHLGLSTYRMNDALKKQRTSLASEIRRVRLNIAQEKLVGSDAPIAEIADQLGFSDAANFTRFFKGETGSTPKNYRRDARLKGE